MPFFTIRSSGWRSEDREFYATGPRFSYWEQRRLGKLNGLWYDRLYPGYVRKEIVQTLKKRLVVIPSSFGRDNRVFDLLYSSPRRVGISDKYEWNSEYNFSRWCNSQLEPGGAHFNAVHAIVDDHLLATNDGWNLYIENGATEVLSRLKKASDLCVGKIRPIYEADIAERQRAERERQAMQETEREMNAKAEQRIMDSNVKMAIDDLDRYILGHKGLT